MSRLEEILPCISCGSQADEADGFGTCTCGNEAKREEIRAIIKQLVAEGTSGTSFYMPIKSMRNRNTAFKKYAVKFMNGRLAERRERILRKVEEL